MASQSMSKIAPMSQKQNWRECRGILQNTSEDDHKTHRALGTRQVERIESTERWRRGTEQKPSLSMRACIRSAPLHSYSGEHQVERRVTTAHSRSHSTRTNSAYEHVCARSPGGMSQRNTILILRTCSSFGSLSRFTGTETG